ncbi:MAG: restriction endonuclease subunit S [Actinomyces sp.]|uniref:restriction endonuclease subunit S n=1 Tax=Actinomyces sp. TaxID=29317 RepID=UPI000AF825A2|nr:restriction endonuclease subunit S [Actinomyces sp.]MDU2259593.1 restriction endonuclease subunit S [Actinomyces sp.]MDU5759113.1 restriction endonuclease subunit S [Actinomyces sp.]
MSVVFQEGVLSDIARVTMGQSPKKEFVSSTQEGLPLLNGPTEFGSSHPTPVQWSTSFSKTAEPGDILFCVRGSTTGRMNWADQQYAIGRGIASISAINPQERHFVRAAIDLVLPELLAAATGSTFPNVSRLQLSELPVALPSAAVRTEISGLLGALDDKIESNRRIAFKCDEVASELFGQAASMNQKLDEVSEVRMGVSPPGFSYNETGEGIAFFQGVRDFSYLHPVARVYTNAPKRLAKPGDILFSVRAPVGRLNIADSTCCIGRGLAAITSNRSAICLFALRAAAAEWEKFSAEGTVFGAVNQKSLKSTLIPWPDPVAEEELEYQLSSLVALASQSERESISLSKLRDTLLPELMSGRMRVDEAGRLVSEALDEEVADV